MSTSTHTEFPVTFQVTGPLDVSVSNPAGTVEVTASGEDEAIVDLSGDNDAAALIERATVALEGEALRIEVPQSRGFIGPFRRVAVRVRVPWDSTAGVEVGSADVRLAGRLGAVTVGSGSGDVTVEEAGEVRVSTGSGDVGLGSVAAAEVKSGSGDVEVAACAGDLQVSVASGDVRVGHLTRDSRLSTASGDVEVTSTSGRLGIRTVSGKATVGVAAEGELECKTASGDVLVGVPEGTAALLDCSSVSGRVSSDLEAAEGPAEGENRLRVSARSVSGSITVKRSG